MKKLLMVLGGIFAFLIVIIVISIGFVAVKGSKLDSSSKAYVDESVPLIVSTWSKDELLKRASPELRKVATDEEITQLFTKLSTLGALKSYDGSKGDAKINYDLKTGMTVSANYIAEATFENGKGHIKVTLLQRAGNWQILNFYVESPFFIK